MVTLNRDAHPVDRVATSLYPQGYLGLRSLAAVDYGVPHQRKRGQRARLYHHQLGGLIIVGIGGAENEAKPFPIDLLYKAKPSTRKPQVAGKQRQPPPPAPTA